MEPPTRLISADDHVIEHPRVWTDRLSKERWGDQIPHIEHGGDGSDYWLIDGRKVPLLGSGSAAALMPERAEPRKWEDMPPAAYQPAERLKLMDSSGVERSVLYPSVAGVGGETFAPIEDPELELDCVRAYNDWLIEEWAAVEPRFVPQCIVPLSSVAAAVGEIRHAVAAGHRGVIFPPVVDQLRNAPHINEPSWDQLWSVCEELQVPICFHAGSLPILELAPYGSYPSEIKAALHDISRPACSIGFLSNLLMSHILERHPHLTIIFGESSLGWVNFVIETVEHNVRQFGAGKVKFEAEPRELLKSRCRFISWYDDVNLQAACNQFGADCVLWAWNFPNATSEYPDTPQLIEARLRNVSAEARSKIIRENAARLYQV
ncbi:MAG: amidohydrolase family protein [Deltaproteobacteria bacterium]|nr:amidohydrolase family protein [Deltaproteobacteria bacterium]